MGGFTATANARRLAPSSLGGTMSGRLPVGEVINEAFQFAVKRLGTIIRLGWAPILLTLTMTLGFVALVFNLSAIESSDDPSILLTPDAYMNVSPLVAGVLGIGVMVVAMLLMAGFMASVYRLVALVRITAGF